MNLLLSILFAAFLQTTSVQGVILKLGSNEPLAKATVELKRSDSDPQPYTFVTVEDGKFVFPRVQPGTYQLSVKRSGYVPAVYGQRKPEGPGQPITIVANTSMTGLRIIMTPSAVISGRITDRNGQAVVNAEVQALRVSYPQGVRTLKSIVSTVTNDLGEYRLFGLTPGSFYVGAIPSLGVRQLVMSSAAGADPIHEVRARFQPMTAKNPLSEDVAFTTYFPGTADSQVASVIDLKPGGDIRGIDFIAAPVRARHIRGTAINNITGQPLPAPIQLTLNNNSGNAGSYPSSGNPFDIQRVNPGTYTLTVTSGNLTGRTNVEIVDRDVDVNVPVSAGYAIPGRISYDGDVTSLRVTLRLDSPLASSATVAPKADGSFVFPNIPNGTYRLSISPELQNAFVKSAEFNERDVLNSGLQLDAPPSTAARLAIVIDTHAGALEGVAVSEKQEPMPNVTVALIPDLASRKRGDLFKSVTTDPSGRFQFKSIAPGDYKVFAWEDVENGAWLNEDFMKPFEILGKPLRIVPGTNSSTAVVVIPSF